MNGTRCLALTAIAALVGCGQDATLGINQATQNQVPRNEALAHVRELSRGPSSRIGHVVVIIQENRTTNNLFNGLPGAYTVRRTMEPDGKTISLLPVPLDELYDLDHSHRAFEIEYRGKFDVVRSKCEAHAMCPPADLRAYGYVPKSEVEPYFVMASSYAFGDRMFETNEGPSFPAHQYILSGTSTITDGSSLRASENPVTPQHTLTGGCDSPPGTIVAVIDEHGDKGQPTFPCFKRNSLIQLLEAEPLSWRYYQSNPGPGLWHGPDAIAPVRYSREFSTDVVSPPARVLTDIAEDNLARVVWVTPTAAASDHPGHTDGSGPSWVASVVNAIGESKYWNDTAIFVTWDDWGGWFDPVEPEERNSYELGFRVPLIVISPYAKRHYVSHVQHEFGSILKFTEEAFGLPSLGTTDKLSDDLSDCFDFSQAPSKFQPIAAPLKPGYFLKQPISNESPDDDY
jgi:phospholipase C